ncbi:uroporphyrinogen-III synthase [Paenarthrobacter nicotinovorans]|uniref:uroporphyrinogen-III synthase n=1 Tax=Paenarthrobacter nicotinovorans TaxID=29320 RepID=UPI00047EB1AA|nr:uroporphyrinogen-III synthase [Paenarthrobacter nicotinovorans]
MPHPEQPDPQGLNGRRILITRSADRARDLASLLHSRGAAPLVLPLIDFERAKDQRALDSVLDRLAAGDFDWLVISSITSAKVLLEKAAQRGTTPAGLVPATTRVATIGPTSVRMLESIGLTVHLAPAGQQSADGLVELWEPGPSRVLLPQADIAAPGLREGLASKGADVTAAVAYHTVDYPARAELRLEAELPDVVGISGNKLPPTLNPEEARDALQAGAVDAVVAASPSAARRIAETLLPLGRCRLVAIGRPTAAEATRLGLTVAATAKEPTPGGIVAALESVFANEGNPQ